MFGKETKNPRKKRVLCWGWEIRLTESRQGKVEARNLSRGEDHEKVLCQMKEFRCLLKDGKELLKELSLEVNDQIVFKRFLSLTPNAVCGQVNPSTRQGMNSMGGGGS